MLTLSTTTMLRSGVTRCGLQPVLMRSTACPYSTLNTSSPFGMRPRPQEQHPLLAAFTPKPTTTGAVPVRSPKSLVAKRSASTTAAPPPPAAGDVPALDWNTFFQLRKTRRRWQLAFSLATCAAGGTLGALFLSSGSADAVVSQIPLDPFVTLGLMTFGFAALGWLIGPVMGSAIFYALKSKYRTQMTLKEIQFFARIKKNRVDPSSSSTGNPVPDFYGEKISSVAGYRQWLKDQRAFNKKRVTFV